ncbi:MAG: hypothetical protein OXE44_10810 [Nitrospinae bacterium]|nr:hypothetical protein [Nitrospinota bacterium]
MRSHTIVADSDAPACARNGIASKVLNGCDWTEYILMSRKDELTKGTEDRIIRHNKRRKRICGK